MEEIAQQLREELQEIVDRYKTRLSVPRIMHVAQDVFRKTLSVRHHPELRPEEAVETWLNKRYLKDMGVRKPCKEAYLAGFESCNQQLVKAKEIIRDLLKCLPKENIEGVYEATEAAEEFLRNGDTKCID